MAIGMGSGLAVGALALLSHLHCASTIELKSSGLTDLQSNSQDEVTYLPGWNGPLPSRHFAGYIEVDQARGKSLFYYFVHSERSPDMDPVVVWLNGGPGCSSFDGWMYEHGPLRFQLKDPADASRGLTITRNLGAWSQVANMLYIDSPAGVGLSVAAHSEDTVTNDTQTATDTSAFLRKWFRKYEAFQKHNFFISGESYAGVYVPTLVEEVLRGNAHGELPHINLQGYIVGNGVTDPEIDGNALPSFARGKSLISHALYAALVSACNGSFWDAKEGTQCEALVARLNAAVADLNLYDILDPCYTGHHATNVKSSQQRPLRKGGTPAAQEEVEVRRRAQALRQAWPAGGGVAQGATVQNWAHVLGNDAGGHPPCLDHRELTLWLDDEDVRRALHAAPVEVTGPFQECTSKIMYTHDLGSMIPYHLRNIAEGLRVLVYNGDHDMCVPHTGAEAWTTSLRLPVQDGWRPWYTEGQVAGYTVKYEGLTYATILGAGHFTPVAKPLESLRIFARFLANKPL